MVRLIARLSIVCCVPLGAMAQGASSSFADIVFRDGSARAEIRLHPVTGAQTVASQGAGVGQIELPGLEHPVRVLTDELGVPHIIGETDLDVLRVQGYVHARDRFFQMDVNRRAASGTLAELTGDLSDIERDGGARLLGFRRAAQRSAELLTERELALGQAYVDGINAYLAANPLPTEHAALEISSVPSWTLVDSLTMAKARFAALAQVPALWPIFFTSRLQDYVDVLGEEAGTALLFEDVVRTAPMVPNATVPDASGTTPFLAKAGRTLDVGQLAQASEAARRFKKSLGKGPLITHALGGLEAARGSNIWGVAASKSASGRPMIAYDPHLELAAPSVTYENHLVVRNDPLAGPANATGTTFPGFPAVAAGQNPHIVWGSTTLFTDVYDIFQDQLIRDDPGCAARLCIASAGELHPVEERSETYRLNLLSDGIFDNSADVTAAVALQAPQAVNVLTVPFRSFGPLLDIGDRSVVDGGPATETSVLTLQYTGSHGTREVRHLVNTLRARDVFEFRESVRFNTANLANFVVADSSGNLAYFSTGELPLRADLEAGALVGAHPVLIRDGSGHNNWIPDPERSQGQILPFRVIPFDEMPQVANPPAGFVVNANEDPSGAVLDNDSLNQFRPSNPPAIYYFGSGFTPGLRNGRVTRLLREKIDAGEKISLDDMKRFQANTQQLDAELMTPFLLAAFAAAQSPGAASELAPFAGDPEIVEAMGRLAVWNFSTPTGIPEGYDASDVDGVRDADVSPTEAANSVAATLYNVWRAKLIRNQFSTTLGALGLAGAGGNFGLRLLHHLLSQEPFTGVGVSGVSFFPEPAGLPAGDRRDVALLRALRDALDSLASDDFAAAFGRSTNQDDYRWGRLNRVRFPHPLGGPSSIPPAAGFADLALDLPGISRDGGYETVNPARAAARADSENAFQFSAGSVSRFVMTPRPAAEDTGPLGFNSLPGGSPGDPASPLYASQLGSWLTVDYHALLMDPDEIEPIAVKDETFVIPPACSDRRDNDGDGLVDFPDDPGCLHAASDVEDPECDDRIDNDGDGLVDFPDDPGCLHAAWDIEDPECDDRIDNDGDSFIDFPADPGCALPSWTEAPACNDGIDNDNDGLTDFPDDPGCAETWRIIEDPECSNGIDDEKKPDGLTDFPDDPECAGPWDNTEACGLGYHLVFLLLPLLFVRDRWRRTQVGARRGESGRARVLSLVAAGLVTGWLPRDAAAFATGYHFELLELEIVGRLPDPMVDDFEDGVRNVSFLRGEGLTESGGALHFTDADGCSVRSNGVCGDLARFTLDFQDGAGDVEIIATLAPVIPTETYQVFDLVLDVDPLPETLFAIVAGLDDDPPLSPPCGPGLQVTVVQPIGSCLQCGDPELEVLACDAIDPAAVSDNIILKLFIDDERETNYTAPTASMGERTSSPCRTSISRQARERAFRRLAPPASSGPSGSSSVESGAG